VQGGSEPSQVRVRSARHAPYPGAGNDAVRLSDANHPGTRRPLPSRASTRPATNRRVEPGRAPHFGPPASWGSAPARPRGSAELPSQDGGELSAYIAEVAFLGKSRAGSWR